MSSDLKLSLFASTFRDPVVHVPRPLPIFPIPSSTFIDFTQSSSGFLDLLIHPNSSIHFSIMIDPLRTHPMQLLMFAGTTQRHSAFRFLPFLNKLVSNRVKVTYVAVELLNVLFIARG
jgi:hypothetical protein